MKVTYAHVPHAKYSARHKVSIFIHNSIKIHTR
jgi:hypothetical protein